MPALITALQDKDEEVRQQAAFALSQIRDPKAVDGLLIAIKDSNAEVRQQALFALGQIGDARAADAAMAALKDPDPEVRQLAAHALGQLAARKQRLRTRRSDGHGPSRELAAAFRIQPASMLAFFTLDANFLPSRRPRLGSGKERERWDACSLIGPDSTRWPPPRSSQARRRHPMRRCGPTACFSTRQRPTRSSTR